MGGEHRVVALGVPAERRARARLVVAGVPERDECVAPEPARVVPGDVEAAEQVLVEGRLLAEPGEQVDVGRLVGLVGAATALDPAVPRADVLADVAAVDLGAELGAVRLGDLALDLRPVGEAACGVEDAGLVEGPGRAGVDAAGAGAAARAKRPAWARARRP